MTTPVGEGAQSGAEGAQSGTGEGTGANGSTETGTAAGAQSGAANPPAEDTVPRTEAEALRARMQAADKRAADFEAKYKQLTEKDMPAQEKLTRDLGEAQKQVEKLQSTNQQLALQVAFLKDNTYTWHNPETALKLADLSQVTVEDDGKVSGLKDALKALATSNDYLLKKEIKEEAPKPASTSPGNNGGSDSKPNSKGLTSRLPALSTRVRKG